MKTPHKHAEEIKAWADGAEIQWERDGIWLNITHPKWNRDKGYRIKPESLRYRVFLARSGFGHDFIGVATDQHTADSQREDWEFFIRWLGDWQEVEEAAPRNKYPDLSAEGEN